MPAVSRRVALGAGVLAVGGGAAAAVGQTTRGRRRLHQVGLVDGPDLEVPDVDIRVEVDTLVSQVMARKVGWRLYAPAGAEALIVCFHGRNGDDAFAFEQIAVPQFVAASGRSWAVVSVDGGPASYWHLRSDGSDAQAMIFDELLPAVSERLGSLPLLLLGWSMGGYGALLAASGFVNLSWPHLAHGSWPHL